MLSFVHIAARADQLHRHYPFRFVKAEQDPIVADAKPQGTAAGERLDIGTPICRVGGQLFETRENLLLAIGLDLVECFLCTTSENQSPQERAFLSFSLARLLDLDKSHDAPGMRRR